MKRLGLDPISVAAKCGYKSLQPVRHWITEGSEPSLSQYRILRDLGFEESELVLDEPQQLAVA